MTATPAWTTDYVPPRTGDRLPKNLPPRPTDAASLTVWTEFAWDQVWPADGPTNLGNLDVGEFLHQQHSYGLSQTVDRWRVGPLPVGEVYPFLGPPLQRVTWDTYADELSWWALEAAGSAASAFRTSSGHPDLSQMRLLMANRAPIRLDSWTDPHPNPSDLWDWSAAGAGEVGPVAQKRLDQLLPGALEVGARLHDIAAIYTPFAAASSGRKKPRTTAVRIR